MNYVNSNYQPLMGKAIDEYAHPGEWRIVFKCKCGVPRNGVVIYHCKYSGVKMERAFYDHLKEALLKPNEFTFNGYGGNYKGEQGAKDWLEHHRNLLKLKDWNGRFILVTPHGNEVEEFTY